MMNRTRSRRRTAAVAQSLEVRTLFSAAFVPITFAASVGFVAGTAPAALATADFNGDGNMDLAVADSSTGKIDVFFGNGAGAFSAGPVLALSAPPTAVITGDFNGDSKPDLAVATTAATGQTTTGVVMFLNTGGGAFGLGQITTVETGAAPGESVALAAGDFNSDKKLDLAVTGYSTQSINILFGNSNGTFATPVSYSANQYPTGITEADFNHDGNPDLAVTSTSVNVLAGANNSGTPSDQASLLLDSSTGNFSAGPNISISSAGTPSGVVAANLTAATTPGLLVTNTDGTVTVLTNTAGSFAASAVATVSGGATAIATDDFNLDGNTDFVTAGGSTSIVNNSSSVTVVPGLGSGMLSASTRLPSGSNPQGVVVADFNNDGKPDIATANQGDGTVGILLNTTAIPLVTTTVAVTSDNGSVPAGSNVTFTATITGASVSPLTGESVPTGGVKFYDGSSLLGSTTLAAGANQAQFATTDLIVGSHQIRATYSGDAAYATNTSTRIAQVIEPTATQGPDLVGALVSSALPGIVAPGEIGLIKIQVTNQGNTAALGSITNSVYLSLDQAVDNGDTLLPVRGNLSRTNLRLMPGKSILLSGIVTIPQGTPLASYSLLVALNTTGSLPESVTTNDTAVSPATYAVSNVFGTVAGRAGVVLQTADLNGNAAAFRLTGPGNGTVNIGDSGVQIMLDGTSAASTLTITSPNSAEFVATDLATDSPIGNIRAPRLSVTNQVTLIGGATSVTLASAGASGSDGIFTLGAGSASTLKMGSVQGLNLNASGGIRSLTVGSWGGGSIQASWIGTLRSAQQFTADLTLGGAGAPAGNALTSATIGGTASGSWLVTGNIGRLKLASTPAAANGWNLNDVGSLKSLSLGSTFYGNVAASSIGSVQIRGSMDGGKISASSNIASILITGSLINAGVLAATSAMGTLGSIRVTGSLTATLIGSGIASFNPTVVNNNGTIRSITVLGSVDAASKFLAVALPKRAVLAGVAVTPGTDPHFQV